MLVQDLGVVLALTGSIGSGLLGYILPTSMYFKEHGWDPDNPLRNLACLFILVFGIGTSVLGVYQSI
jgi:hypothetical protein